MRIVSAVRRKNRRASLEPKSDRAVKRELRKKENPLLHQNIQIKEPRNWMGVSISDLGRGYAWSDYIQLVGVGESVDCSVFIIPMEGVGFRSGTRCVS